ncbi:MAG: hypothetical protein AAB676_00210 [Verrucomicrobiota bacterium]
MLPTLEHLMSDGKCPIYVVHFTQLEAALSAEDFTNISVCVRVLQRCFL